MGDARQRELERIWLRSADPSNAAAYRTELLRAHPGLIVEIGTLAVRLVHLTGWEGFGQDDDDAWLSAHTPARLLGLGAGLAPLARDELERLESASIPGCARLLERMQAEHKPPDDPTARAWTSALELSRSKLLPSQGRLEAALGRVRFLVHEEGLQGALSHVLLRAHAVRQLIQQRDPYPDPGLLEAAGEAKGEALLALLEVGRLACGWPQPSDDPQVSLEAARAYVAKQPYRLELGLPGKPGTGEH